MLAKEIIIIDGEFLHNLFLMKKLGLTGIKVEDKDLDGNGQITLEERMHVVIQNIKTLEINSGLPFIRWSFIGKFLLNLLSSVPNVDTLDP